MYPVPICYGNIHPEDPMAPRLYKLHTSKRRRSGRGTSSQDLEQHASTNDFLDSVRSQVEGQTRYFMSENNEELYFRVDTVKFEDLYDWSNPDQKWKSHSVSGRQLRRSNSMPTGSLVSLNEDSIALFRYGELLFAIRETCPHLGGPLHLGDIEVLPDMSICVKCPWHKWCIDLTSGEVKSPKGRKVSTATFPTRVDGSGTIFIGFKNFSEKYFSGESDF